MYVQTIIDSTSHPWQLNRSQNVGIGFPDVQASPLLPSKIYFAIESKQIYSLLVMLLESILTPLLYSVQWRPL